MHKAVIALAIFCVVQTTLKLNNLLRSKDEMQEAVAGMAYEKLRSKTITLDSRAVQKAIHDRVSEAELTSHKNDPSEQWCILKDLQM